MKTRDQLAGTLVAIAILPLMLVSWLDYRSDAELLAHERDRTLAAAARDSARELSRVVESLLDNVRADSGIPGLDRALANAPLNDEERLGANRILTLITLRDPVNITSVGLLDANGINVADTHSNRIGRNEGDEEYFRATFDSGYPHIFGPYRPGPGGTEQQSGVYVASPIKNARGGIIGVLRLRLEPALLQQALLDNLRERPSMLAVLLDEHGRVSAATDPQRLIGEPGPPVIPDADGAIRDISWGDAAPAFRAASAAVGDGRRQVLAYEPLSHYQIPADALRTEWIRNQILLVLLVLGAVLVVAARIARPAVRLTAAAEAIASGDAERRVPVEGTDEFRRLSQAFNAMNAKLAGNLAELSAELEHRRAVEHALNSSREQLTTLIDQIPGAVYRCKVDRDWTMVYLSSHIQVITGYAPSELIDNRVLSFGQLIHADDTRHVDATAHAAIRELQPYELQYRVRHRDGAVRWIWERGRAHRDKDGTVAWLDGILFDVTERHRNEQALEALQRNTESRLGDAFFRSLTQELSRLLDVRIAFVARLLAGSPAQLETLAFCADGAIESNFSCPVSGTPSEAVLTSGACRYQHGAAEQFPHDPILEQYAVQAYLGLPLRNTAGETIGMIGLMHDQPLQDPQLAEAMIGVFAGRAVSEMERVTAELRLRELTEQLELRVEQRTRDLSAANAQLSQAMDQLVQTEKLASLGSLVAGVAHELNTPIGNALTVATSLHDVLQRFGAEADSGQLRKSSLARFVGESREAGELIERNLRRAAELIGHFKQVAVDQVSARRRRFDLLETVNEVLATLRPQLKRVEHRIDLQIAPGIELDSYPGPLEQILTNLIGNSLLHGFREIPRGRILIAAEKTADERLRMMYGDDGVGIPVELQRRVFDPFFTTRLGQGGSGLGLYLVYSLTTGILGGRLTLNSAPGEGACFELDLPLVAPVSKEPSRG